MEQQELGNRPLILCLCETWCAVQIEPSSLPLCLGQYYNCLSVTATRDKTKGRASGGLLMCFDKQLEYQLLDSSDHWICSLVKMEGVNVVFILVYFKPSLDIKYVLESLQSLVQCLNTRNYDKIVIGGDFNCRVGHGGNDYPMELFENTNLFPIRQSEDVTYNHRGSHLLSFMLENSFVLLNGRCASDRPARYTFAGSRGCSTIDLVWVKDTCMSLVSDLAVSDTVTHSYHFQVMLNLIFSRKNRLPSSKVEPTSRPGLRWDPTVGGVYRESMMWSPRVVPPEDVNAMYTSAIEAMYGVARDLGLVKATFSPSTYVGATRRPWFDQECVAARREVRRTLNKFRGSCHSADLREVYISTKKSYKKLLAQKKKSYDDQLISELTACADQSTFWRIVGKYRRRTGCPSGIITVNEWEHFYEEIYTATSGPEFSFYDAGDPDLCSEIRLCELQHVLSRCKNNRTPGNDGVPFEYFKNLPMNWLCYICSMFNRIMNDEHLPQTWSEILLIMLHKKGNADNPTNYRGIALVNCFAKIFTSLLLDRLEGWCRKNDVIPEAQSGFRKGRSCIDNLFTLSSLIQLHLRLKGRKVFAAFVDFRRAFDSISHNLMWFKLYNMGICGKLIRVIKGLYSNATVQIKSGQLVSGKKFKVSQGVLQGESLSPLLFSIFVSDIESFFRQRGALGLSIDGGHDVVLLLYADDLVILSDSAADLNRKLGVLAEYCLVNELVVNGDKTKVMCFQKGGSIRGYTGSFFYNSAPLEIVNKYVYLGLPLTSSGMFLEAAKHCVSRSKIAVNTVLSLISQKKIYSWESYIRLFNSIVVGTLTYAVPVWGLNYPELAERVQIYFVKKILSLTKTTPDYLVRCETGMVHTSLSILKHTLRWLLRVLEMTEGRYPLLCLKRLQSLLCSGSVSFRGASANWLIKLRGVLRSIGFEVDVGDVDAAFLRRNFQAILDRYRAYLISSDLGRLRISIYADLFPSVPCTPNLDEFVPQSYLLLKLPVFVTRCVAQLRTCNYNKYFRLYIKGITYVVRVDELCTVCNMHVNETIDHLLFVCPLYCNVREGFRSLGVSSMGDLRQKLTEVNPRNSKIMYASLLGILRLRAFLRNEW